jgi:hypothetical protein
MARCEAAVRTTLAFHRDTNPRRDFFAAADLAPLAIRFEHRDFVWHPNREAGPDGEDWWPGVTVVADDPRSFDPEKEAMHRFLSALAFHLHEPIEVLNLGGSGVSNPFDRPITRAARGGLGDRHELAPTEVAVVGDDRLRLVLALYREGLNSESPFYRFLSFWNALDAAHNADDSAVDAFIDAQSPRLATLATPHRTKR